MSKLLSLLLSFRGLKEQRSLLVLCHEAVDAAQRPDEATVVLLLYGCHENILKSMPSCDICVKV